MVRSYGHKLKLDEGNPFSFCSFSLMQERAKWRAEDVRKNNYNARVIPGKNESGRTIWLVYKRKKYN